MLLNKMGITNALKFKHALQTRARDNKSENRNSENRNQLHKLSFTNCSINAIPKVNTLL
jgi:hypothetical protein